MSLTDFSEYIKAKDQLNKDNFFKKHQSSVKKHINDLKKYKPPPHTASTKPTILAQYRGLWFSNENSNAQANFYSKLMKKVAKTQSFQDYVAKNNLASIAIHQSKLDKMLAEEHAAYFKLSTELNLIKK